MIEAERFAAWANAHFPHRNRHQTAMMWAAWLASLEGSKPVKTPKRSKGFTDTKPASGDGAQ